MDSVLDSIKKLLNLAPDYEPFDQELVYLINSSLAHLRQLGVAKGTVEFITNNEARWSDVLEREDLIPLCMNYVYIQTRLEFDPPTSGTHSSAMNDRLKELEWRIYTQASLPADE